MSGTEADYRDDLGEMDGIGERPLRDFLPPPEELVRRDETVKVTLALSRASLDFSATGRGARAISTSG